MDEEELEIVEKMEKYGGSFVQALAQCFRCADPCNFAKLRITFANYGTVIKMAQKRGKELGAKSFVIFKALRKFVIETDE